MPERVVQHGAGDGLEPAASGVTGREGATPFSPGRGCRARPCPALPGAAAPRRPGLALLSQSRSLGHGHQPRPGLGARHGDGTGATAGGDAVAAEGGGRGWD
jgi:hypothetical protein